MFTFGKAASKKSLKKMVNEHVQGELIEPKQGIESWETRQVEPSSSRGLGMYFAEVSRGKRRGWDLQPEDRVSVWNLPAYEKVNLRLGHSDFNKQISYYRTAKNFWANMGSRIIPFWEWLAS